MISQLSTTTISHETRYTLSCEIPAWDEHYVILPGEYAIRVKSYFEGHAFLVARVKARVVHAKKSALWGGVAVTKGTGPDAGTIVDIDVPLDRISQREVA